jgi:lysophospholipase L1-like esterase
MIGVLAAGLALPASAHALTLAADRPETGWIRLSVGDAANATRVTLTEGEQPVADAAPSAGALVIRHATIWRCNRRERRFDATATYPDGTTQTANAVIHTPSCRKRFALSITRKRSRARVRVHDRWKVGGASAEICVGQPRAKVGVCRRIDLRIGMRNAARAYRMRTPGVWNFILLTGYGQHAQRMFYVRPHRPRRLLATGDSMIQIVDTYLKQRLAKRHIRVRSDARISTGISKPFLLNWPKHARRQARRLRPDVTVVSIGANDGFPFGNANCCGDRWVAAYAKRVEAMMRAYSRGGQSLVYWLTLPAPRPAQWRRIYPAVNRAIKRAAANLAGSVRVVDIAKTFTPGNRFRQSMTWHGHRESVRGPDGVHLSPAGASIAETLIERALRKDGAL